MPEHDVLQYLEDPSDIDDPELQELMARAEDLVTQAYTTETGEIEEAYLEQAENVLEQYEWVQGLEKESGKYEF